MEVCSEGQSEQLQEVRKPNVQGDELSQEILAKHGRAQTPWVWVTVTHLSPN